MSDLFDDEPNGGARERAATAASHTPPPEAPMAPHHSRLVRVKHGGAETVSTLIEADNMSVREDNDGGVVLELFRYAGDGRRVLESFQLRICQLDRVRVRGKV